MKKVFKTLLIVLALFATACSVTTVAFAEKKITADKYIFIGTPKTISCDDKIYIVGDDSLFTFSYDYKLLQTFELEGIKSATGNGIITVFSTDEGIYLLTGEGATKFIAPKSDAYCVIGTTLYYANGATITSLDLSNGKTSTFAAPKAVTSLAVVNGTVYFSVLSDVDGYGDVYSLILGEYSLAYDYCRNLVKLIGGDKLRYYSTGYVVNPDSGERIMLGGDLIDVSRGNGAFYYVTYGGELYKNVNGANSLVFACTSADKGYFSFPKSTYSDFGRLFVMDYANNRVAVMENDITYLHVARPVCATSDYSGNLYVAGKDGITVFNSHLEKVRDITCPYGAISSLTYSDGTLYACVDGQVYPYDGISFSKSVGESKKVKAEYYGGKVYSLTAKGVVELNGGKVVVENQDAIDFDIDYAGTVYVLTAGKITTYQGGIEQLSVGVSGDVTAISLSNVSNFYTDYGNVVLTKTRAHSVNNLAVENTAEVPVPNLSFTEHTNIIRTTVSDAFIYENPCSIKKVCEVKKGATVIVGKYDLYESERMSYVLFESESGLKTGYMYKGLLSAPVNEVDPPATGGNTVYENTSIYKFPSAGSDKIVAGIGKNVYVTLLPFAEYEFNGMGWYKVRYNNKYGFIAKDMVSITEYVPTDERPQYNASLKTFAGLYQPNGNSYVETGKALEKGTEVEIVGSFDQNRKYTRIKYFDKVLGVQEGYVLTSSLEVYNVTTLQIVGLVGAGVVILLIALAVIVKLTHKRKLI